MNENEKYGGGCCCGAVRYQVPARTIWSAGCCCRDCARASGTPYTVWVGFSPEHVRFTKGELRIHESSQGVLRGFCTQCGTALTYGRDPAFEAVEPTLYVAAASLDDPEVFPPTEVVWYGQRPAWFSLGEGIPLHETVSPQNAARSYATVIKDR